MTQEQAKRLDAAIAYYNEAQTDKTKHLTFEEVKAI